MSTDTAKAADHRFALRTGHHIMMLSCLALLAGAALFLWGSRDTPPMETALLLAPALLCIVSHVALHRFMRRHGQGVPHSANTLEQEKSR